MTERMAGHTMGNTTERLINKSLHLRFGKYTAIGRISFLTNMAYIAELLWRTVFMALIIFIFSQLWAVIYSGTGALVLGGLTYQQMIWYLVMTETIALARPRIDALIDQEVKNGDVAYRLSKPYSYLLYHYVSYMAEAVMRLVINFAIGSIIAYLTAGGIQVSLSAILLFLPAALVGLSIEFLVRACIGLGAFWVEDTESFLNLYEKALFILGGMLIPLELLPETFRRISAVLPMNFVLYRPARLFAAFDVQAVWSMFGGQAVWLLLLAALCAVVYRAGVKRINVNGG